MEERLVTIYCLTFPNGKEYVGQTVEYVNRMRAHRKKSVHRPVSCAIQRFGWENVVQTKLCIVTEEDADTVEEYFIKIFETMIDQNGYNLMTGGQTNKHYSEETRAKMRAWKRTAEQIEKTASKIRGRKQSPEEIAKRSASLRGRKQSAEERQKHSIAMKGIKWSKEARQKAKLKPVTPEILANLAKGRVKAQADPVALHNMKTKCIGRKHTEEELQKMRGRKATPEQIEAMRKSKTGKKMPDGALAKSWATRRKNKEEQSSIKEAI